MKLLASRWQRLDTRLARLERGLVVLLLTVLLGLGLLQAVWRNLFAGGLFWADELLQHIVLWLGLLGASLATHEQRHLSIDALARLLPRRWQRCMTVLTNAAACAGCLLLGHAAWRLVHFEQAAGTMLTFHLPTWVVQSIIPLGFGIMALRFGLHAAGVQESALPARSRNGEHPS
jgi:TRAP-type C4-dicarboxylate transport system permease small subunit